MTQFHFACLHFQQKKSSKEEDENVVFEESTSKVLKDFAQRYSSSLVSWTKYVSTY